MVVPTSQELTANGCGLGRKLYGTILCKFREREDALPYRKNDIPAILLKRRKKWKKAE